VNSVRVLVRDERKHNDGRTKTRTTPKKTVARPCGAREGIVLVSANRRRSGSPIPFGQSSLPRPPSPIPNPHRTACTTTSFSETPPPMPSQLPSPVHHRATIKIDPGRVHNAREKTQNSCAPHSLCIIYNNIVW